MNLFFDTSALVKLYHKETGTNNLIESLQRHPDDLTLLMADISKLEFRSAIMKRVRIKEIKYKTAQNIVKWIRFALSTLHNPLYFNFLNTYV